MKMAIFCVYGSAYFLNGPSNYSSNTLANAMGLLSVSKPDHKQLQILHQAEQKAKVVPYTLVRRRVPVREDTDPEPSECEVGWPAPFLAAFS